MEREQQGWFGVLTEPVKVKDIIKENNLEDLLADPEILDFEDTNIPIEEHPHFTGIYGLTNKGCYFAEQVQNQIANSLKDKSVKISALEVFNCQDGFSCLVGLLEKDNTITSLREKLMTYDHNQQEFDDYKPHLTICWFNRELEKKEKDSLIENFSSLIGKELKITGVELDNPYFLYGPQEFDKITTLKFNH